MSKTKWSLGENKTITSIGQVPKSYWKYGQNEIDFKVSGQNFVRSISDTIGITDDLSRSITFVRSISDTIGITDVISVVKSLIKRTIGRTIVAVERIKRPQLSSIKEVGKSKMVSIDEIEKPKITSAIDVKPKIPSTTSKDKLIPGITDVKGIEKKREN